MLTLPLLSYWPFYVFAIKTSKKQFQVIDVLKKELERCKNGDVIIDGSSLNGSCTLDGFELEYHWGWRVGSSLIVYGEVLPFEFGSVVKVKMRPHLYFLVSLSVFVALAAFISIEIPVSYVLNPRKLNFDFVPTLIVLILIIFGSTHMVKEQYLKVHKGLAMLLKH
jgi:hypothetical protein